jgi:hypothetical protein
MFLRKEMFSPFSMRQEIRRKTSSRRVRPSAVSTTILVARLPCTQRRELDQPSSFPNTDEEEGNAHHEHREHREHQSMNMWPHSSPTDTRRLIGHLFSKSSPRVPGDRFDIALTSAVEICLGIGLELCLEIGLEICLHNRPHADCRVADHEQLLSAFPPSEWIRRSPSHVGPVLPLCLIVPLKCLFSHHRRMKEG